MQGDVLALYLFILCLDYVLGTSIGLLKQKMAHSRKKWGWTKIKRYPAETITDADYADDLALFVNISA